MLKILITSIALALTMTTVANATCSNSTIKGSYGMLAFGFESITQGTTAEPYQHVNIARTAVFDGKGGYKGMGWESIDGVVGKVKSTGTYIVNASDCTVTITGSVAGVLQFGVISDGGKKILGVRTDAGRNISIIYEKQ
jgi:hypothetical protein